MLENFNLRPDSKPEPTNNPEIESVYQEITEAYNNFYSNPVKIPLKVFNYNDVPRGQYIVFPSLGVEVNSGKVLDIKAFVGRSIAYFDGNYAILGTEGSKSFSREILGHEYVHSQAEPAALLGVSNPILTPRDLKYQGELHYVSGFKAVNFDPKTGNRTEVARQLEEYVTQYLTMCMLGEIDVKSPALEQIFETKTGIDPEYIEAADILHGIFTNFGITPQEVEQFHRKSDILGFLNLVRIHDRKTAAIILASGTEKDRITSIKKLRELKTTS